MTTAGSGTITFDGSGALVLANLTGFSFAQTTTLSDPALQGAGSFTYGLSDVTSFTAVYTAGAFSSLSLRTKTESDPSGFLADQSFQIRSLRTNGASTAFDDAGSDTATTGTVRIAAAVPELSSWATMVAGFGIVGGAARRRRVRVSFA